MPRWRSPFILLLVARAGERPAPTAAGRSCGAAGPVAARTLVHQPPRHGDDAVLAPRATVGLPGLHGRPAGAGHVGQRTGQRRTTVPSGPSSTVQPAATSSSRSASARAK